MPQQYEFPRAALTVDAVVFGFDEAELKVLLIKRGLAPFKGRWALPGGFVRVQETLDDAVRRELEEETGLRQVYLEQLYTFGEVKRDPRERVVSVAYYALVKMDDHSTRAATDASDAQWFPVAATPPPEKFTLSQLQHLYETVLGTAIDKRNFRKKVLGFDLLEPLDETHRDGPHRPAQLHRFNPAKYERLKKKGFLFEL